ncbi:MAG: ABC transporter ATP-binding protein [Rhodospirillaceae bacterium]
MADALHVRLRQTAPIPLDAAFDCYPGEVLALVGPSGAGKSTILRAIAGLASPANGLIQKDSAVWYDPTRGIDLPVQQRRVGMVFQDYALFPHLTALENIVTAMGHLPPPARACAGREIMRRVNLSGLEDRKPRQLSGGQRQRVALARALARDPQVLLLDEPFAAVDQVTRRRLQDELAALRGSLNVPTVLVTHDLSEARNLGDRVCVLYQGRTLQTGEPEEIFNRPKSPLIARLTDLGNLFSGRVSGHDRAGGLTAVDWRGVTVHTHHRPEFAEGAAVAWVVPPAFVVLHRGDRQSRGERENPAAGTVSGIRLLGDTAMISMSPENDPDTRLIFSVAAHTARRNGIEIGGQVSISLLAEGVHLMHPETPAE